MNLYHVQDDDRPMWVAAETWVGALERWRERIREENADDPCDEPIEPNGISLVARRDELILPKDPVRADLEAKMRELKAAVATDPTLKQKP